MWKIWDSCRRAAIFGLLCLCRVGIFFSFGKNMLFIWLPSLKTSIAPEKWMVGRLPFFGFVLNLFSVHRHVHAFLRGEGLLLPFMCISHRRRWGSSMRQWRRPTGRAGSCILSIRSAASSEKTHRARRLSRRACSRCKANKTKNSLSSCLPPITRLQRVFLVCFFFECIYSIILFEIKHVYTCHVLFFCIFIV